MSCAAHRGALASRPCLLGWGLGLWCGVATLARQAVHWRRGTLCPPHDRPPPPTNRQTARPGAAPHLSMAASMAEGRLVAPRTSTPLAASSPSISVRKVDSSRAVASCVCSPSLRRPAHGQGGKRHWVEATVWVHE